MLGEVGCVEIGGVLQLVVEVAEEDEGTGGDEVGDGATEVGPWLRGEGVWGGGRRGCRSGCSWR